MMKTVAVPVAELKAMALRDAERTRVTNTDVVGVEEKNSRLETAQKKIDDFEADVQRRRDEVIQSGETDEIKAEALKEINAEADEKVWPLLLSLEKVKALMTDEDRGNRLTELDAEDEEHHSKYGPQPLTQDEIAVKETDAIAAAEYIETRKYADDRAKEYPQVSDQLDAIWLGLKALALGERLPAETEEMISAIEAVKAKYPKPGVTNG